MTNRGVSALRVLIYSSALTALAIFGFDSVGKPETVQSVEYFNVEGNHFSEPPTCAEAKTPQDGDPIYGKMLREKSRLEFLAWAECGRKFFGYAVNVAETQVVVLTTDMYMEPAEEWAVTFCLCPHRFLYELGSDFSGEREFVLLWNGNRFVIPANET